MSLHTVTLWTTLLLLIASIVAPIYAIVFLIGYGVNEMGMTYAIVLTPIFLFFTALPLLISSLIVKYLKYNISLVILLVSTIAYSIWYIFLWLLLFVNIQNYLLFFVIPIFVTIPAWIIAYFVDWRYRKKNQPTPSEP